MKNTTRKARRAWAAARLCGCNPDRVLKDHAGRVLARVEGAGFYDPLEFAEGSR